MGHVIVRYFCDQLCLEIIYTNFFSIFGANVLMASYTTEVSAIHKKFNNAVKRAKTKKSLNKAYSVHKKAHERLLKKHLREETVMINKAKKKLD